MCCVTPWPLGSLPALRSHWPILESSAIGLLTKPKDWLPLQRVIPPPLTHLHRNSWRGLEAGWQRQRAEIPAAWALGAPGPSSHPSPRPPQALRCCPKGRRLPAPRTSHRDRLGQRQGQGGASEETTLQCIHINDAAAQGKRQNP